MLEEWKWGRLPLILNGELLEEVDCFKYLGSQVAADGGCERDFVHTMNQGYGACGALKSVLSNGGLVIKAKKCLCEGVIVPYGMGEYHIARWVLMAEVSGDRVRGRPRLGWIDGVKVALDNRGMTVEAAQQWEKY